MAFLDGGRDFPWGPKEGFLSLEQKMACDRKRVPRGAFSFVCNCPKVYFS